MLFVTLPHDANCGPCTASPVAPTPAQVSGVLASMLTRAVLLHGLVLDFSLDSLTRAPAILGSMVREILHGKPRPMATTAPVSGGRGGYDTVA